MLMRWWLGNRQWREPVRSDRLPIHRSESPTGYSSAGCSPAEPASASPVTENSNSIPIQRGNQMRCSIFTEECSSGRPRRVRRQRGCHLYSARRVTFQSCADSRRVCVCRRARRRRHPSGTGGGDRAAIWRAIPAAPAAASASLRETTSPALSGQWNILEFLRTGVLQRLNH